MESKRERKFRICEAPLWGRIVNYDPSIHTTQYKKNPSQAGACEGDGFVHNTLYIIPNTNKKRTQPFGRIRSC